MATFQVFITQEIRYTVEVDAESPAKAVEHIESGMWDDSNNMVLHQRVRVYDESEEQLLLDTKEG